VANESSLAFFVDHSFPFAAGRASRIAHERAIRVERCQQDEPGLRVVGKIYLEIF
jgi:hypothetical protein